MTVEIIYGLTEGAAVTAPLPSVSAYVHKTDHQAEAAGWLLTQFDNSPKVHAWLKSLVKPYQTLEDALNVMRSAFNPYTAVGDQLSRIGAIVGEERAGRADSVLRAYVLARIAVNTSDGLASSIYRVARLILGTAGGHTLRIERVPQAKYILHIGGAAAAFPWDLAVSATQVGLAIGNLVTQATSAGIGVIVHYQGADDAHTFTFASADAEEVDANRGLADDAATTGGAMSDYAVGVD